MLQLLLVFAQGYISCIELLLDWFYFPSLEDVSTDFVVHGGQNVFFYRSGAFKQLLLVF